MTTAKLDHESQTIQMDRQLVAGRYRLHDRVGHGRLGEIYEAVDEGYKELGVGQHVAIQLLPERIASDRGLLNKLKVGYTELRAASHPNIVNFLGFDHDGKFGYLAMGFLDGASLRFVLDDVTTLPFNEAIPVIRAIGDALRFLHARSIVHGQLSADSVFITEGLEVRLLDVVPLGSDATILRNIASSDPFSRCDVEDDIYALACLAYEMLAGRHPFNFQTPAEARAARLEPARIDSLSEKQWNAIRRALSFDREQRTTTVTDFLHELGITGSERLRRADDTAPKAHSWKSPHEAHSPTDVATDIPLDRPTTPRVEPDIARAKSLRTRRLPLSVLLMALVGLGAWYFYGQPRDDIVVLTDYVESYLAAGITETSDGGMASDVNNPAPAAPQSSESAIVTPGTPTQVAEEASTAADTTVHGVVNATEEDAMPQADEQMAAPGTDAPVSNDDAVPPGSKTELALIQSTVILSERDGAARITTRRPQNADGQFFWWTSDHTAIANTDYIPIDQPVAGFASGEEAETIHIPLVNDSVAEAPESFYVYLGQHDAQQGRLVPVLWVRVDINDDD